MESSRDSQQRQKSGEPLELRLNQRAASIFGFAEDRLPLTGYCLYSGPDFNQASSSVGKISDSRTLTPLDNSPPPYIEIHRARLQYSQVVVTHNNVRTRLQTKHPASSYNLIIPLQGSHTIKHADGEILVSPGEACFTSCNQVIDATRSRNYIALIAALSRSGFEHFFGDDLFSSDSQRVPFNYLIDLQDSRYRSLTSILAIICAELDSPQADFPWRDTVIERLEEAFWIKLMDAFPDLASFIEQKPRNVLVPGYVKRTTSYIEKHMDTDLRLSELVKISRTSQRSLQQGFKDIYGVGPMTYVKQMKLDRVRQNLLKPDPNEIFVGDIAAKWGFFHLSNFSRYYRQAYGEHPSDTLKKALESKAEDISKM